MREAFSTHIASPLTLQPDNSPIKTPRNKLLRYVSVGVAVGTTTVLVFEAKRRLQPVISTRLEEGRAQRRIHEIHALPLP